MSDKLKKQNIVDEMSNSFLDYAMSVIVSRALPDVRDGLKPVHRRILYAMNDLGNYSDKPYKKSARIVGDVIGKYHPHGDSSVYSAMVRMAQDFSFRLPLVDGHGNFGSLDGDGAAAMRYTEARMSKVTMELLKDISKNTVDFVENYDGSEREPSVLPSKFPNLLVNGASGIAVGMATSIPPHNLGEVINGTIEYIKNNDITIDELMEFIKGPDFPLGAQILGNQGIIKAYNTGNGSIKVRARYSVVEGKKDMIVFHDIPFQVNKSLLVEKIAENVKNKRIEGITDLRDESDRDGIRIVLEISKNIPTDLVINKLFKYTQLESNFAINMLALVNGEPKVLDLKEVIKQYHKHQVEIIVRRTKFDLKKADARKHILDGLLLALNDIDDVIKIIRGSQTQDEAQNLLIEKYDMTQIQVKAILEMQLRRLTGLERDKLNSEIKELMMLIEELNQILSDENKINELIIGELTTIKEKYSNDRRSEILPGDISSEIIDEDLIESENVIVSLTTSGYVKRINVDSYRTQNRGGKGVIGMSVAENDEISILSYANTHTDLLFLTENGTVYKCRTHMIPEFSRTAKGIPLINVIDVNKEEKIKSIISIDDYAENYLFIATKNGIGKKTKLTEYQRINKNGKKAINLNDNDLIVGSEIIVPGQEISFLTKKGKSLLCEESDFRTLGRVSTGVKAISLEDDDALICCNAIDSESYILTVTANGFGKATHYDKYRKQCRAGKGIINLKVNDKTGNVVAGLVFHNSEKTDKDIMLISKNGIIIRQKVSDIKISGRSTVGVIMMRVKENDFVSTIQKIDNVSRETFQENDDER